jgi:hypothetical protein
VTWRSSKVVKRKTEHRSRHKVGNPPPLVRGWEWAGWAGWTWGNCEEASPDPHFSLGADCVCVSICVSVFSRILHPSPPPSYRTWCGWVVGIRRRQESKTVVRGGRGENRENTKKTHVPSLPHFTQEGECGEGSGARGTGGTWEPVPSPGNQGTKVKNKTSLEESLPQ